MRLLEPVVYDTTHSRNVEKLSKYTQDNATHWEALIKKEIIIKINTQQIKARQMN